MFTVKNILTPTSDEWYARERIGREPLIEPFKDSENNIFSLIKDVSREYSPIQKERELDRSLRNYDEARNKLKNNLENIIPKIELTNIDSIFKAIKIISLELSNFIESIHKVINKLNTTYTRDTSKSITTIKEQFNNILKIHTTLLNLLKCCESVIKINFENNLDYIELRNEILQSAIELQKSLKDLSKDSLMQNAEAIIEGLNELFASIGIEEFLNKQFLPESLKGTSFDLPSKMSNIALALLKKLTDQVDKEQILKCYDEILSKNNSISELVILACKEIIKLEGYELTLKILDLISDKEKNKNNINDDISILKLYCQVGLKDFDSVYKTLENIPKEILIQQDDKLLFEIQQILQDEVQKLYESNELNEIIKIANEYQEIFSKNLNNQIVECHQEFLNKAKNNETISEALQIIFPEFAERSSNKLEFDFRVMASDIESLKQSQGELKVKIEKFAKEKCNAQNIPTYIVFGLILNSAILLKEIDLASEIIDIIEQQVEQQKFSSQEVVNIITCIDKSGYSVASTTLYSGNQNVFDMIIDLVQSFDQACIQKTDCIDKDLWHLDTIIRCPKFEIFDAKECIENFIKPLYSEDSISNITSLIGEY